MVLLHSLSHSPGLCLIERAVMFFPCLGGRAEGKLGSDQIIQCIIANLERRFHCARRFIVFGIAFTLAGEEIDAVYRAVIASVICESS